MIMKVKYTILFILLIFGCSKESFLNKKPDNKLIIPETLEDVQSLLDNTLYLNGGNTGITPTLMEDGTDDYILSDATFSSIKIPEHKERYIWGKEIYGVLMTDREWGFSYSGMLQINLALDVLSTINRNANNQNAWDNAYGSAKFFRAMTYFQLAQTFL
jgi:hypothetical protein